MICHSLGQRVTEAVGGVVTDDDVGVEEEVREPPRESAVSLEVVVLVVELGQDAQCVFEERDDDQEAADLDFGIEAVFELAIEFDDVFVVDQSGAVRLFGLHGVHRLDWLVSHRRQSFGRTIGQP